MVTLNIIDNTTGEPIATIQADSPPQPGFKIYHFGNAPPPPFVSPYWVVQSVQASLSIQLDGTYQTGSYQVKVI